MTVLPWRAQTLIACLSLVAAAVAGPPAEAVSAAAADAGRVPKELRHSVRYLSLHAVPEKDRPEFLKTLAFHVNSLSREAELVIPAAVNADLVRVNLLDYGWSRDTWEKLAKVEPYFHVLVDLKEVEAPAVVEKHVYKFREKVSYDGGATWVWRVSDDGQRWYTEDSAVTVKKEAAARAKKNVNAHAPWLPAKDVAALALATNSDAPIVRADWFLFQTAVAQDRVAGYYDWLGLGKKEADFQELCGVDVEKAKKVKREIAAAVARSGVTLNNRAMERFQSITGPYWRTHDFKTNTLKQNTLRLLDGDTEPPRGDASEQYGTLPNGLFAFWLQNKDGERQNTAPDFIASDGLSTSTDRRVHAGLSCIRCHSEGIRPIDDWVRRVHQGPVALSHPDYEKFKRLRQLYLSDLEGHVKADQLAYGAVLARLGGKDWTAKKNADAYAKAWQRFADADLTIDAVAGEVGVPKERLLAALKAYALAQQGKAEPLLVSLLAKDPPPLRREHLEEALPLLYEVTAGASK